MNTIEMTKKNTEIFTIERYMSLTDSERKNFHLIKIIPPRFDNTHKDDFGRVLVRRKTPVYESIF